MYNLSLILVLIMAWLFAYRIFTFKTYESMIYLVARLICLATSFLLIFSLTPRKVKINKPVMYAVFYSAIATVNILIVTRTSINDFADAILWPSLFVATYLVFSKGKADQKFFSKYINVAQILCLIFSLGLGLEHLLGIIPTTSDMFPTYVLLALTPFALYRIDLGVNRTFNWTFLVLAFVILAMTSKRSCILVIAGGMIAYYIVKAHITGRNISQVVYKFFKYTIIVLVVFVGLYFVVLRINPDLIDRIGQMFSGDMNGRDALWEYIISAYKQSTMEKKILGHGYHAFRYYNWGALARYFSGNLAHNDYLNTLYDYGIIGLVFYVCFLISIIEVFITQYKKKSLLAPSFAFSIVLLLVLSFVSYLGVESRIFNYVVVYWGYTLAIVNHRRPYQRDENSSEGKG